MGFSEYPFRQSGTAATARLGNGSAGGPSHIDRLGVRCTAREAELRSRSARVVVALFIALSSFGLVVAVGWAQSSVVGQDASPAYHSAPGDYPTGPIPGAAAATEAEKQIARSREVAEDHSAWLESTAGQAAVADSETAYTDDDDPEAASDLIRSSFPQLLAQVARDPARVVSDLDVEQQLSESGAIVSVDGRPELFRSPGVPLEVRDGGQTQPVDLGLEHGDPSHETENGLVNVELPEDPTNEVSVGDDLSFNVAPADSSNVDGVRFGDKSVLYADAGGTDTDLLIGSVTGGAEVIAQLRSSESPNQIDLDIDLPIGATPILKSTGIVEFLDDGTPIGGVSAPLAIDATGAPVASHR